MFQFFEPSTLEEAITLSARCGPDARLIAGGTDLVIQMRKRGLTPPALINIQRLEELAAIDIKRDSVTIGALVTHRQIEQHVFFDGPLRGLIESAQVIGGRQVRNVATVGGNICNASPAADIVPILLALDATVHLAGTGGKRSEPLSGFIRGPRETTRQPDEIVTAVSFVRPSGRVATAFMKAGRRRAMEISIISMAAMLELDKYGRIGDVSIAVGAAGPKAIRLPEVERLLLGASIDSARLEKAAGLAVEAIEPISDVRASADYRRHLTGIYLSRILHSCSERIGEIYNG